MVETPEQILRKYEQIFAQDGLGGKQRRLTVLREFLDMGGHPSAGELALRLKQRGYEIPQAAVAEMLEQFCRYGLAHRLVFDTQPVRYEYIRPGRHHDHIICVRCGAVVEINEPDLHELARSHARQRGFSPVHFHMETYALCPRCLRRRRELFPLAFAAEGERVCVEEIRSQTPLQQRLIGMGITPGTMLTILSSDGTGPLMVVVREARVAIGRGMAQKIFVSHVEVRTQGDEGRD